MYTIILDRQFLKSAKFTYRLQIYSFTGFVLQCILVILRFL